MRAANEETIRADSLNDLKLKTHATVITQDTFRDGDDGTRHVAEEIVHKVLPDLLPEVAQAPPTIMASTTPITEASQTAPTTVDSTALITEASPTASTSVASMSLTTTAKERTNSATAESTISLHPTEDTSRSGTRALFTKCKLKRVANMYGRAFGGFTENHNLKSGFSSV